MYFAAGSSAGSSYTSLLLIVAIGLVFYFVLLRPMKRRQQSAQRQQQDMRSQLGPGDKIVTIGGLYGTVVSTDDESITLEISPGVTARYDRNAIARVLPPETANTFEDDEDVVDGADLDFGSEHATDAPTADGSTDASPNGHVPSASNSDDEDATPKSIREKSD